jgi:hypothetical protein
VARGQVQVPACVRERGDAAGRKCVAASPGRAVLRLAWRARLAHILDLLAEENQLNVYAGELEVRPPGAPTTEPHQEAIDRL